MNYAEWKANQQGAEYTLPSGLDVRLKKVSLPDLAASGSIPQTLIAPIDDLQKRAKSTDAGVQTLGEMVPILNLIVSACLVEPVELTAEELPFMDKLAIFEWANEEPKKLAGFRSK